MRDRFARIAGRCVERPVAVVAAVAMLAVIGAVAALRLEPDAGTDQLVDSDSAAYHATQDFEQKFGDDAVVVLVKGDLRQLVLTSDLGTLLSLEGCLSGNVEGGNVFTDKPAPAPCAAIADAKPAQAVLGGATFLNQSAIRPRSCCGRRPARRSRRRARPPRRRPSAPGGRGSMSRSSRPPRRPPARRCWRRSSSRSASSRSKYGQTGIPRLDDPTFVSSVVFDPARPGQPKPRFSLFWPSADSAQILVRLRPDLSQAERSEAIDLIRDAVADPAFRIRDADYVVSGAPVVVDGLAEKLSSAIFVLLIAALVVMTLTLALVFRPPVRLLPLAVALVAAAITFGLLAAFGGSLTMASIAVLPILIGLAVDYAIQFQARFVEARASGSSPPRAAVEAGARGGPVIGTAAAATVAGFLVLLLSPIPMIRGFGLLLVVGIAIAFVARAHRRAGAALAHPQGASSPSAVVRGRLRRVHDARAAAGERAGRIGRRALAVSVAAPGRVLAVALVLAVAGWVAGTRAEVISDLRELVPSDLPELQNVDELQDTTGVSGEVEVAVRADDLTDPAVVAWMGDFKQRVLDRAGFQGTDATCAEQDAQLCPFVALSDLFGDQPPTHERPGPGDPRPAARVLPGRVRERDAEGSKAGTAVIPFGIKVMPFDEQKQLIDSIRVRDRPAGDRERPARRASPPRSSGCRCSPPTPTRRSPTTATCSRSPGSPPSRWRCWPSTARRAGRWCR